MPEPPPLIAVVDDEKSVRVALGRLCRAYGMAVAEFGSAHALVASLTERTPDCVILDLQLPDCEGVDADRWLLERGVHVPVIIITGRDDAKISSDALVVHKPVDAATLFAAIRNVLDAS